MTSSPSPCHAEAIPPRAETPRDAEPAASRPSATLVWVEAREATVVRWHDGQATLERLLSEVPPHHRATGHVRQATPGCPGGGAPPRAAGEQHRLEHLARFVAQVAEHVPVEDDILILGPGTVRERLARLIAASDRRHGHLRAVRCEASRWLTGPQLVARTRVLAGDEPRRRNPNRRRRRVPAPPEPAEAIELEWETDE